MQKELLQTKVTVDASSKIHANVGADIGYEKAAKMIKNLYDHNPEEAFGYFAGKNIIEAILAQPGCVGIRFYTAMNEIGVRQLVYVGVNEKGQNILEYTVTEDGEESKRKAIVADKGQILDDFGWNAQ